jgi:hypothetical protein
MPSANATPPNNHDDDDGDKNKENNATPQPQQGLTPNADFALDPAAHQALDKKKAANKSPATPNEDDDDEAPLFDRVFTLDEAAAIIPHVEKSIRKAQRELIDLKESLILTKRLMAMRRAPRADQTTLYESKREQFERTYQKWIRHFHDQGMVLRDLDRGLVDFPYQAPSSGEFYFLSWHQGDEGLFYFHELQDHAMDRWPISLLPE